MRAVCLWICLLSPAFAQRDALPNAPTDVNPGSITYDEIAYPYPVAYLPLTLFGQDVRTAYMDVLPAGPPNGGPDSRDELRRLLLATSGMLSARFAASFPDITECAVIYKPIGLTDPRYERPWRTADEAYKATMAQTNDQRWQGFYADNRRYFPSPGAWKPEYEQYVRILCTPMLSGDWPRLAMVCSIDRRCYT